MQTLDNQCVGAIVLRRSGMMLAAVSVVLGAASFLFDGRVEDSALATGQPSAGVNAAVSKPAERPSGVQVVAAESHSLSSSDWLSLLSGLASDLRLGLSVEIPLPSTTSNEPPPDDPLKRLIWAQRTLDSYQIELKVEQGTIRIVSKASSVDGPLEANAGASLGSHPWERLEMRDLQAFPPPNRELSFHIGS